MGCVQGRSYGFSPERFEGMKADNGYVKGDGVEKQHAQGRRQQQQHNMRDMSRIREQEGNGKNHSVEVEKRIIGRDQKEMIKGRDGIGNGNGNGVRIGNELSNRGTRKMGGDELVDGWPKWLVDNIPKEVLAGLVPKSADSYDKLAKVSFSIHLKADSELVQLFRFLIQNALYLDIV